MDKAEIAHAVASEVSAARGCLAAAMNNLAGAYGKEYRSCVKELYYACFHMATALLASKGLRIRSHEATQELLSLHFVKPAAMLADTARKFNALMDRGHTADYKTFLPMDASDVLEFKPWVGTFISSTLRLLGKSAPATEGLPEQGSLFAADLSPRH